jgi:hypothetical protein
METQQKENGRENQKVGKYARNLKKRKWKRAKAQVIEIRE